MRSEQPSQQPSSHPDRLRYWSVETPTLHDVEASFLTLTHPGGSTIVSAHDDAEQPDPDGRYLVLYWDGTRVHRWQGHDPQQWRTTWRTWNRRHLATTS